jgi:membrane glycosyltransferase
MDATANAQILVMNADSLMTADTMTILAKLILMLKVNRSAMISHAIAI